MKPIPGPKTLSELREQVNTFQRDADVLEARLAALTRGTHELNRAPGIANKVNVLRDQLTGRYQALKNAQRVLDDAESIPGYDDAVARWYANQTAGLEHDDE